MPHAHPDPRREVVVSGRNAARTLASDGLETSICGPRQHDDDWSQTTSPQPIPRDIIFILTATDLTRKAEQRCPEALTIGI